MFTIRQILVRMRQGDRDREIARSGLMGRKKLGALRNQAAQHGWLDPQQPLPDDCALAILQQHRQQAVPTQCVSTLKDHEEQIAKCKSNARNVTIGSWCRTLADIATAPTASTMRVSNGWNARCRSRCWPSTFC